MRTKKLVVGVTTGISALSFLRGQLAWFVDNGWEVVLVSDPDDNAKRAAEREKVRFEGISMRREISPLSDSKALWKWIRLLMMEKPSAVNVGTPKAGLLGTIAAFLTRVPKRLYIVRGLRLEGTKGILYLVLWGIEKLTMMLATDVFFVSRSLSKEADRLKLLPARKAWLIGEGSSNGVPAKLIAKTFNEVDAAAIRDEIGLQVDDFVIGFIGRINRDKGVDLLIQALESPEIKDHIKVLFVGGVEDHELEKALEKLGNKAVVIPWVENPWKFLSVIDVLCLPSLREGFPNVVLEAAAVGIPSIVTSATGAVDSVIDGETGIVLKSRIPAELVEKINKLASDRGRTFTLGSKARDRVISHFEPERIWKGILEIFEGKEPYRYARKISNDN